MSSHRQRVPHIDWLRGLACVLMFQTHAYDAWLGEPARQRRFFHISRLLGTLPAPLFLFLTGISAALMILQLEARGTSPQCITKALVQRGAKIFGLGLLFRLQEFLLGQPGAPWTDLFRVDILNTIGLSLMLLGAVYRLFPVWRRAAPTAAAVGLGISGLTPPLWSTHRLQFLPWYLESYLNGVHTAGYPQPWLFPLFPWAAFALLGLTTGLVVFGPPGRSFPGRAHVLAALVGLWLMVAGPRLEQYVQHVYRVADFWHSSPSFFLLRTGILLVLLAGAYLWCGRMRLDRPKSPLVILGRHSLLVYWVHIEFVYGRFSLLAKGASTITEATMALGLLTAAMWWLAFWRDQSRVAKSPV